MPAGKQTQCSAGTLAEPPLRLPPYLLQPPVADMRLFTLLDPQRPTTDTHLGCDECQYPCHALSVRCSLSTRSMCWRQGQATCTHLVLPVSCVRHVHCTYHLPHHVPHPPGLWRVQAPVPRSVALCRPRQELSFSFSSSCPRLPGSARP